MNNWTKIRQIVFQNQIQLHPILLIAELELDFFYLQLAKITKLDSSNERNVVIK